MIRIPGFIAIFVACGLSPVVLAKNVDLSTVPRRDGVQLTIYNAEDLTLVRETRTITFKKGVNPLQFSWANTLIDPTSVEIKFLTTPDKLELLDTTYPHDKPQMLYWNVQSEIDGQATIQISYFTSGISWSADYLCIADKDETRMGFEGFVRVINNSGEEYEDAEIRLVVGSINLVEKIAKLANIRLEDVSKLKNGDRTRWRDQAARETLESLDMDRFDVAGTKLNGRSGGGAGGGFGRFSGRPKEIVKEGLSEYFIYTIEGTETIKTGWSKRMRSFEGSTVPFKIQYRYRPAEYGDQLVRMYLLTNNKESKLGTTPLPNGIVRVFRDNGREGLSFLVEQPIKYVPIGDKIELNLGPDRNVIFELIKLRTWRDEIWMQIHNTDIFRRIGGGIQVEVNSSVVGWDDHEIFTQRIRNYTPKAIEVEVRRTFPGHILFKSALNPVLHDFQTPQFTTTIASMTKSDLFFGILRHQGRNSKQNNVTLEQGEIKP